MSHRVKRRQRQQQQTKPRYFFVGGGVFILILLATGLFFWQRDSDDEGEFAAEVSVAAAFEMRSKGAFILDVRERSEWDEFHMPGATLIPLGELANRVDELPRDQEIVVVCRSGNRSREGRDILLEAGFTTVTSMAGGMNNWQSAGYPME